MKSSVTGIDQRSAAGSSVFLGCRRKKAGNVILRTVGLARAKVEIGLRNLAYNMDRLETLLAMQREKCTQGAKKSKWRKIRRKIGEFV